MSAPGLQADSAAESGYRRPSLRRRLLLVLLVPMLVTLVLDAIITYAVALAYANHVHDNDLGDDVVMLAQMLQRNSNYQGLSAQARFMLEYDADGHDYFSIRGSDGELLAGNPGLRAPTDPHPGAGPVLADARLDGKPVRMASMGFENPAQAGDLIVIAMAENFNARRRQARQILLLAVPLQATLILVLLVLVRFGVGAGLKVLDPLTARLARRERDLKPIDGPDVPIELLPLTRTIDALFARQRQLIALHERFISDAAHQLRTPLAGLSLHAERAREHAHDPALAEALQHIGSLTARVTRTCNQLLALTRAQAPPNPDIKLQPVDLVRLLRDTIELRLHGAWNAGIDLGYEGPAEARRIRGNPAALQEMLDNLIDNAMHYAGRGGTVTVVLDDASGNGPRIRVIDDGPGVAERELARLGERFYRGPASTGTGLGLAIVEQIAQHHDARVYYSHAEPHGLCVEIRFPVPGRAA